QKIFLLPTDRGPAAMVCPSCSTANPEDVRFCSKCGWGLRAADDSQTIVLDAPAATQASAVRAQSAGVMSPPPDLSSGVEPDRPAFPAAMPPGTAFGSRYRIESLVGEGGMGSVYKAHDFELGRTVALKLVRPELARNPQTIHRFKQELLLASRISHKNVLRIHDLSDLNGGT